MTQEQTGTKVYQLIESQPLAIVIHCSDPRFQLAFKEFIRDELHLQEGEYIPLIVSGGVASLSEPLKLPKEFKFMKERIELFMERFDSINRIVLINHEDCRHYEALKDLLGNVFLHRVSHMNERQLHDLQSVAKAILGFVRPDLHVELYYASLTKGQPRGIEFQRLSMQ